jgi:Pvc16 N-terminal domain
MIYEAMDRSVQMDNVAIIEQDQSDNNVDMEDSVILTMINMDEEKTLKNFSNKAVTDSSVIYKNERINLNLYILFCANRNSYVKSLKDISKIIEFFQGKRLFTQANSNYDRDNIAMSAISDFRFTAELYTPTFEELNFIWGTLGGKQYPSALYKLSLIEIERSVPATRSTRIGNVDVEQVTIE